MLREILSLLRSTGSQDVGRAETDVPVDMLHHAEPMPFPSESDRIRELTPEEHAELRKKLRTKLSSRRYSRRRKENAKAQAALLHGLHDQRERLQKLTSMLSGASTDPKQQQHDMEARCQEFSTLLRETTSTAANTFSLYEQAERMTHPEPNCGLAERALRPDHLSDVRAVHKHWSESDQLNRAVANVRAVVTVLSDARRDSSPDFFLSMYKGWRVVECKRRGSRFCVLASKRVVGMARQTLIDQVWQNADDPTKRVVMCTHYTRFSVVTSKKVPLNNSSCAFYSEELHEFPPPFLCRSFTSIHGVHNDGEDWYYVKHSIDGNSPELEGHGGAEIVGVVLQDATRAGGVNVELALLYDTQSVCHAKQLVCEEPCVSHRVLSHWEKHHGIARTKEEG